MRNPFTIKIALPVSPTHFLPVLYITPAIFITRLVLEHCFERMLIKKYSHTTAKKASESMYYFLQYSCLFCFSKYLIIAEKCAPYNYESFFADYPERMEFKPAFSYFFCSELSVYIVSTLFLFKESRRTNSDFIEMCWHHLITCSLILTGYCRRHFNYGLMVANLHDVTDLFLESSKTINYLVGDPWAVFTFIEFAIAFCYTRLIVFPKYLILPIVNGIGDYEINKHDSGSTNSLMFSVFERFWFVVVLGGLWLIDCYWMLEVLRMIKGMLRLEIHGDIRDDQECRRVGQSGIKVE